MNFLYSIMLVLNNYTVQVRDKHMQNAQTIFAKTRVQKRMPTCTFVCLMRMSPFVIHSRLFPASIIYARKRKSERGECEARAGGGGGGGEGCERSKQEE